MQNGIKQHPHQNLEYEKYIFNRPFKKLIIYVDLWVLKKSFAVSQCKKRTFLILIKEALHYVHQRVIFLGRDVTNSSTTSLRFDLKLHFTFKKLN